MVHLPALLTDPQIRRVIATLSRPNNPTAGPSRPRRVPKRLGGPFPTPFYVTLGGVRSKNYSQRDVFRLIHYCYRIPYTVLPDPWRRPLPKLLPT